MVSSDGFFKKMSTEPKKPHHAWLILIGCCCMMAAGLGAIWGTSGVFVIPVCGELGFTRGEFVLYLSFHAFASVITAPIAGHFLPRFNIRILMTAMTIIICLSFGMMSTYHHLWQWYLSGTLIGICSSFIFVLPTPLLIDNWFKKRSGLMLGIATSFSGIGAALFSPLFTSFINAWGWRTSYVFVALIFAALILPWTLFVFRYRPSDMGLLPYGAEEENVIQENIEVNTSPADDHKVKVSLSGVTLKMAVFSLPFICVVIFSSSDDYFGGLNNQLPALAVTAGYTAAFGALLLSMASIGNVVMKLSIGYLVDKVGIVKASYVQMATVIFSCMIFVVTPNQWLMLAAALLFGVQNSIVTLSEPLLVRHYFGEKYYAQIYSYVRAIAGAVGAAVLPIAAFIYDHTSSYDFAFIIGIGVALLLAFMVFLGEKRKGRLFEEK